MKVQASEKTDGLVMLSDQDNWGALCEVKEEGMNFPLINKAESELILEKGTVVARGRDADDENFFRLKRKSELTVNQISVSVSDESKEIVEADIYCGDDVPRSYKLELVQLLNKYRMVIATQMKELGLTDLTEFDIEEVEGSRPVRSKPYRLSEVEREALRSIVRQLEDAGMIERSRAEYASPVLLVKKADGGFRMVIDYRKLNKQTVKLNYPLPLIDDVLQGVANKAIFSTFDLAWGYFQIPMSKRASEKAAFVTPEGHFQPKVLMMGLCNAPAVFQEMMVRVRDMIGNQQAFPFLDDVITASVRYKEHLEQIEKILEALRTSGLTVRLEKCKFFMAEVEFLGFRLSKGGIQPGTRKLKAVEEFPRPNDVHEVRRFLGLTSFFRRFVVNYATRASPLTELLRKGAEFLWGGACEKAFQELKGELLKKPILISFKSGLETELHTDASGVGLGAILLQKSANDGRWRMVYAISRKLPIQNGIITPRS